MDTALHRRAALLLFVTTRLVAGRGRGIALAALVDLSLRAWCALSLRNTRVYATCALIALLLLPAELGR